MREIIALQEPSVHLINQFCRKTRASSTCDQHVECPHPFRFHEELHRPRSLGEVSRWRPCSLAYCVSKPGPRPRTRRYSPPDKRPHIPARRRGSPKAKYHVKQHFVQSHSKRMWSCWLEAHEKIKCEMKIYHCFCLGHEALKIHLKRVLVPERVRFTDRQHCCEDLIFERDPECLQIGAT